MEFEINGSKWVIKEVSREFLANDVDLAETDYMKQEIVIWEDCKCKRNTLKHELCHVWLWEYGHIQNDEDKFHYEQVCQIVANSNDFINSVVEKYFKKVKK